MRKPPKVRVSPTVSVWGQIRTDADVFPWVSASRLERWRRPSLESFVLEVEISQCRTLTNHPYSQKRVTNLASLYPAVCLCKNCLCVSWKPLKNLRITNQCRLFSATTHPKSKVSVYCLVTVLLLAQDKDTMQDSPLVLWQMCEITVNDCCCMLLFLPIGSHSMNTHENKHLNKWSMFIRQFTTWRSDSTMPLSTNNYYVLSAVLP